MLPAIAENDELIVELCTAAIGNNGTRELTRKKKGYESYPNSYRTID